MFSTEATREILDTHDQENITIRKSVGMTRAARNYEAAMAEVYGAMWKTARWFGPGRGGRLAPSFLFGKDAMNPTRCPLHAYVIYLANHLDSACCSACYGYHLS